MSRITSLTRAGIATVAVSVVLAGCSSATKTEEKKETSTTTTSSSATTTTTKKATAEPTTPTPTGTHRTIQDYIKENNIQETVIKHGDPGASVDLPVPDGWEVKSDLPEAPYGAIVYTKTAVPDNPPRILAIFEKLTGNVDPAQILALAPGELQNIPGFDGPAEGSKDQLGGYDAVQLGGHYDVDGKQGMIAQKTVVIPGQDGLYVLQLNAYSDESEADVLMDATNQVDEQTKITP